MTSKNSFSWISSSARAFATLRTVLTSLLQDYLLCPSSSIFPEVCLPSRSFSFIGFIIGAQRPLCQQSCQSLPSRSRMTRAKPSAWRRSCSMSQAGASFFTIHFSVSATYIPCLVSPISHSTFASLPWAALLATCDLCSCSTCFLLPRDQFRKGLPF